MNISSLKTIFKAAKLPEEYSFQIQKQTLFLIIWLLYIAAAGDIIHIILQPLQELDEKWPCLILFLTQIVLLIVFGSYSFKNKHTRFHTMQYVHFVFICIYIALEMVKSSFQFKSQNQHKEALFTFNILFTFKFIYFCLATLMLSVPFFLKLFPIIAMTLFTPIGILIDQNSKIESFLLNGTAIFLIIIILQKERSSLLHLYSDLKKSSINKIMLDQIPDSLLLITSGFKIINSNIIGNPKFSNEPDDLKQQFSGYLNLKIPEEIKEILENSEGQDAEINIQNSNLFNLLAKLFDLLASELSSENRIALLKPIKIKCKEDIENVDVEIKFSKINEKICALLIFSESIFVERVVTNETDSSYKTLMLASLSHELRTPLNSSLNLIQAGIQARETPHEVKTDYLIPASHSMQVLLCVVNDLLDFSQLSSNKFRLNVEKINIKIFIEKVIRLVELQAAKKGIYILSKFEPNIPDEWQTDPDRLCQVLMNLLTNAIKYTSKGGIVISIYYNQKLKMLQLKVADTGLGMHSEVLDRLKKNLETFDEQSQKLSIHSTGLGLGLTISNYLVTFLGRGPQDHIRVKSILNKGSEFHFLLEDKSSLLIGLDGHYSLDSSINESWSPPLKARKSTPTPKLSLFAAGVKRKFSQIGKDSVLIMTSTTLPPIRDREKAESLAVLDKEDPSDSSEFSISMYGNISLLTKKYCQSDCTVRKKALSFDVSRSHIYLDVPSSNRKVLIVDDDSFNILSMELVLKNLGIKADHAYNGLEALKKVCEKKFDIVIMDCNMPIMDGWEATRKIVEMIEEKKIDYVTIIGCTAYEDAESLKKCSDSGMKYIIQKPITQEKVSKLLEKVIDSNIKDIVSGE